MLVHEPDGTAGQVGRRLRDHGYVVDEHLITADYAEPDAAAPFPSLADVDLLVPMGSVRSLTQKHEIASWIHDELDLVSDAHDRGIPILGVCFGGQLIADALGGSVEQSPRTELGWVELDDGPDGPNPIGRGPWLAWHHDRFHPPPGAEVLATTAEAVHLIRMGRTVGLQFHPEVDVAHLDGFLSGSSDDYLAEHGTDRERLRAEMLRHEARSTAQCRRLVDWFVTRVVRS